MVLHLFSFFIFSPKKWTAEKEPKYVGGCYGDEEQGCVSIHKKLTNFATYNGCIPKNSHMWKLVQVENKKKIFGCTSNLIFTLSFGNWCSHKILLAVRIAVLWPNKSGAMTGVCLSEADFYYFCKLISFLRGF